MLLEVLLESPPNPKNDPTAEPIRDNNPLPFELFLSTVVYETTFPSASICGIT